MRDLGRGAQRVAVPQPLGLGGELDVLAGLRVDRLDLVEPEAQQVGLLPARAPGVVAARRSGLDGAQPARRRRGSGERGDRRRRRSGRARRAAGRAEQPLLVGLAVHGDEVARRGRQAPHRHGPAAEVGPAAALGRDGAGEEQRVVVELRPGLARAAAAAARGLDRRPGPRPARAVVPVRTSSGVGARPEQQPEAVTTIVLPAPVSPVTTVSPGPSSSTASSMTPSPLIRISSITRRVPAASPGAPRHPSTGSSNLRDQPVGERRLCSRARRSGLGAAAHLDAGAGGQLERASTVAPHDAVGVVRIGSSTASTDVRRRRRAGGRTARGR